MTSKNREEALQACKDTLTFFKAIADEKCRLSNTVTILGSGGSVMLNNNYQECHSASSKVVSQAKECLRMVRK